MGKTWFIKLIGIRPVRDKKNLMVMKIINHKPIMIVNQRKKLSIRKGNIVLTIIAYETKWIHLEIKIWSWTKYAWVCVDVNHPTALPNYFTKNFMHKRVIEGSLNNILLVYKLTPLFSLILLTQRNREKFKHIESKKDRSNSYQDENKRNGIKIVNLKIWWTES